MKFLFQFFKDLLGLFSFRSGTFLCDSCEYDYPNACSNPDRPNALKCRQYKKKAAE